MKGFLKKRGALLLLISGIVLMVGAVAGVVIHHFSVKNAGSQARKTVQTLYRLMPEVRPGVLDDRINVEMPALEVDGRDYVGIIEVLKYDRTLPIAAKWDAGAVDRFPCRYTGSIYDGTLIIGGSDNEGQFDFMKLITGGDAVHITDVTGTRYAYVVTDIQKSDNVSTANLTSKDTDLVFYARNTYSLDYTIVHCKLGTR